MTYGRLDYPPEKLQPFGRSHIELEANTDIERAMRLVACAKEPWTVAAIEAMQPGEVLWDIGANVGSYTLLAAARGLHVVAFEPMFENFATLCRNLANNKLLDGVIPLCLALGPGDGMIWVHFGPPLSDARSGSASHTINDSPRKISFHKQLLPMMAAVTARNMFGLPAPHVIKLDVDGGEAGVLAGAEQLLSAPELRAIICELQRNDQGKATATWMAEHGWDIVEAYEPRGPIQYALFGRHVEPKVTRAERRRQARDHAPSVR